MLRTVILFMGGIHMRTVLVCPNEPAREFEITNDLAAMQEVVGGMIQAVYPFDEPVALVCNDEGKLLNLPLNRVLRDSDGEIYDAIAGPFFLCSAPPDSEQFGSLSEEQVNRYLERFRYPELFLRIDCGEELSGEAAE